MGTALSSEDLRAARARSLYTDEIDPLRMIVALEKARELRQIWPASIDAFLLFLQALRSVSPETGS